MTLKVPSDGCEYQCDKRCRRCEWQGGDVVPQCGHGSCHDDTNGMKTRQAKGSKATDQEEVSPGDRIGDRHGRKRVTLCPWTDKVKEVQRSARLSLVSLISRWSHMLVSSTPLADSLTVK